MSLIVKVPTVGESISEVTIAKWNKKDGEYVNADELLCELESDKATFELNAETAGILHKEGVKVAITTDHPVTRIQDLAIWAGFAAKEGLGIEEGLKAITINAAEICNVSHRVGSIEAGKDADLAIFDGNPMEIFTKTMSTIIDGAIVYKSKDIST